ncbi:histidine kinase [Oceanihabitans sp. 2_MG-2023]|uniref:sensor histidine kinase n=1 Tax=Oceanihabitans sp. 2_MG-2023 TaxID=3062661 RepID=UPI0026E2F368|nr:sensor histidine kinase [Oceanihabitans sp. 2_MG-2023]MDO6597747.1 histidine kinase [Oceanihabitans sp. 2_MG-2023]
MRRLLLILCFLSVQVHYGQQAVSIHLTEKDGLPDIEFYDIAEDQEGYIWLAADKGLYRYNGSEYTLFTNPQKKGRSLFGLTFDAKGRLWCNNLAGQFFYVENEKLILFKEFESVKFLCDFIIFKNHLIINNNNNEALSVNIETKEETFTSIKLNQGNSFSDLEPNPSHFHQTLGRSTYKIEDPFFKNKKLIKTFTKHNITERGQIKFFEFENTLFYFKEDFSNQSKLILSKIVNNESVRITFPENIAKTKVNHAYIIDNKLWILTNSGVFISKIINDELITIEHLYPEYFISDVLVDSNLNYWFTTINNGVFVVPNQELKIYNSIYKNNKKDISDIAIIDSENYYVATLNGKISKISSNKVENIDIQNINEVFNIAYNKQNNTLLVSSRESNIIYNLKTKKQQTIYRFYSKSITTIDKDNYLLSLPYSAAIYNVKKDSVSILRNARSYSSVYDNNTNKAYVSYIDGFRVHDLNTNTVTEILNNNKPVLGSIVAINNNEIACIATHNNGVIGFKNNKKLFHFNTKNGLQSNTINGLQFKDNTIWVATDKGIQSYNYLTKKSINITKQDGLASGNINTLKVVDNQVVFGSNLGLFHFDTNKIEKERQTLKPYFTSISIAEKDTILQKTYTLKQDNSEIRIAFNTNGLQTKEFVEYAYKIEGYNKQWIPLENNVNFVKINTLPSGKYTFKVKAKNKFSTTFSKPISIQLKITSLFYKTWVFYFLMLIIIASIIWYYFNKKTKRLQKEQAIQLEKAIISEELVLTQLENLRSQMNPHFIFNALNSIQDYIILNEKKLARQYLVKFSRLIRTYLEHSQTNEVTLNEEIKTLNLYLELEKERFDDDLSFHIHIDESLDVDAILVPSLFIQPYVENALKHGLLHKTKNKKLQLNFLKDNDSNFLICEIIDNGIGREASAKIRTQQTINHKPFATSANQKRIDLINRSLNKKVTLKIEDVVDKNLEVQGTKVILKIALTL